MATTENLYTGNGATTLFPFTFEYIDQTDVRVSLDGADITEYSFANETTISIDTAPAVGVAIRIYRSTDTNSLPATFFSGSTIQASDLNDNFNVTLFVAQEAQRDSADAGESLPTAQRAEAKADAAVATANQAALDASTANDAAANAQILAIQADNNAQIGISTANTALSTAEATAQLVADASLPLTVPDVASIPSSPGDGDLIEVSDSTGIENFSPLTGLTPDFEGEPALAVRLVYTASGSTWTFQSYRVNDPDDRYTTDAEAEAIAADAVAPVSLAANNAQTAADNAQASADAALPKSGGTMTGVITFAAGQVVPATSIADATETTKGVVLLSDDVNSTRSTTNATAATPAAVKTAYDRASVAINTANNAATTATNAETTANGFAADIATANTNAADALAAANFAASRPGLYVPQADIEVTPNVANVFNIASINGGSTEPWMKIEIVFRNVNISGSDGLLVQVGDAGGNFITTGYQSASQSHGNGSGDDYSEEGFLIRRGDNDADVSGRMTISWLPGANQGNGELVQDHTTGWRGGSEKGTAYGGGFLGTSQLNNLNGFPVRFRMLSSNGNLFTKGRVVTRLYSRY